MSTLVRLKAELEAEAQCPTDSTTGLASFREVWSLAKAEGRKEQELIVVEMRSSLQGLAAENERLEGAAAAAQKRVADLEDEKAIALSELQRAERELMLATSATRDAGLQATKALQELADARNSHANQLAALQAQLTAVQRTAHEFELELVRARALLESQGVAFERLQVSESKIL